jgi:hypothetical protein
MGFAGVTEYRRADQPPTSEQIINHPQVKALIAAGDAMARALRVDDILPGSPKAWEKAVAQLKEEDPT